MSSKSVFGISRNRLEAENTVVALQNAGFALGDISVLWPDQHGMRDVGHEKNTKAPEGAVAGGSAGGVIGGTLGLLAGIGALAIPGLGPFIAAGPIMAALSGVAAGAALGGVTGALVGMGIPEIEAKHYEGKLRSGNILVAVHTENGKEVDVAKDVLTRSGLSDISSTGEAHISREKRAS